MTELEKLKKYLDEHDIINLMADHFDSGKSDQIIVYIPVENKDLEVQDSRPWGVIKDHEGRYCLRMWDVVCHEYSYGGPEGLLEIYGDIADLEDVDGWLTAEDVIEEYIKKDSRFNGVTKGDN